MFNNTLSGKQVLLAIFAVMTVTATVPMSGMAATAAVDTETTNTTTTSDWTDETTLEGFNASADNHSYVEVQFDGALDGEARLAVLDPSTAEKNNEMESVYTNSSAEETDATNNHYAWNISHDELSQVPVEASANNSVVVKVWDSGDKSNATYMDLYLNTTDERTVLHYGDADAESEDSVEISEKYPRLGNYFDRYDVSTASIEQDNVGIAGKNTTVSVVLANDSLQDAYTSSYSDDADDGAFLPAMSFTANSGDIFVPVYLNEKPDDMPDFLDENAYAVYDNNANTLTVHPNDDEDLDSEDELDVSSTGNDGLGFFSTASNLRDLGAGFTDAYSMAL